MAFVATYILDAALSKLDIEADKLYITSVEATTFTEATTTYGLGVKTALNIGSPVDRTPNGRKVTVATFSDGAVTGTGTAAFYAIVDSVNSRLLATGSLSASQVVTAGNIFSLSAMDIGISAAISG